MSLPTQSINADRKPLTKNATYWCTDTAIAVAIDIDIDIDADIDLEWEKASTKSQIRTMYNNL